VDVGELVRAATRSVVPAETPVVVTVADDVPMVPGHVDALGRALTNVLLNAVEASAPGSPVEVAARCAPLNGRRMVEVSVRDRGVGIPQERLPRIWEPYFTHKPGGTGLGLAIVQQTLLAHDGAVSAESTTGAGTTIRLFLPVEAPGAAG
jgi:signal transduction histidine kinase